MNMHAISPRQETPFRPATAYEVVSNRTRRQLLDYLRTSGRTNVFSLADEFELSNLKIHNHLRLLEEAGLVRLRGQGAAQTATFRLVGWARLKKQWVDGMKSRVGLARVS